MFPHKMIVANTKWREKEENIKILENQELNHQLT